MAEKVILNEKFSLKARDFFKGAYLAVIAAVAPLVQATIDSGTLTFNWKAISITAVGAFVAYIVKKALIDPPMVITTYATNEGATKVAEDVKQSQ